MRTDNSGKEVTSESVNLAIAWYQANRSELQSFLPFKSPGVTFGKGWIIRLERMIGLWESEKLALYLAGIYIHRPLKAIVKGMRSAAHDAVADAKNEHSS